MLRRNRRTDGRVVIEPVLEVYPAQEFTLWPLASPDAYGYLHLHGGLAEGEVAAAVMRIAEINDLDPDEDVADGRGEQPRPPRPAEPVAAFLHGLFTLDVLYAAGGLRVTDTSTGVTVPPGCCVGLEEWRAWADVVDGDAGAVWLGHDPTPRAARTGDTVRLTADADAEDSPFVEVPVPVLRELLGRVERDLADFLRAAGTWARHTLPGHADDLTESLARVLAVPPAGNQPR